MVPLCMKLAMTMPINRTKISQIISRQVISVSPDTLLSEAVAIMAASKISCIVVAEHNQPLGIFTERDLVRQAHRQSPPPTANRSVMS